MIWNSEDIIWLAGQGFRSILSLESLSDYVLQEIKSQNLEYLLIYVPDHTAPSQPQIDEALDFIEKSPKPIYVHCLGGIGRSATVVACWLVSRKLHPTKAISLCGGLEIASQIDCVYNYYIKYSANNSTSATDG